MSIPIQFVKSAVLPQDFPIHKGPEIAFAGRSNAGKSSLLNLLAGQKIAKVSQTPGKTRLLNFFKTKRNEYIVDMPGYGFAARSRDEVVDWQEMIEGYLQNRNNLVGLILVMDIRRQWSQEEDLILRFCQKMQMEFALVLTKSDKLTKSELLQKQKKMQQLLYPFDALVVSNLKKTGLDLLEKKILVDWFKSPVFIEKPDDGFES